jgi:AcrR family transcriptional regulator
VSHDNSNRKTRLLKAGVELVTRGDGETILYSGLTAELVTKQAGYARSHSFNQEYPGDVGGKTRFLKELLLSLVSGSTRASDHLGSEVKEALASSKGEPVQVVRQLATWNFILARDDPGELQRMAALILGRNTPHVMKALSEDYGRATRNGIDAYIAILAKWGATLRAPFTPLLLAIVLTALVEGLALRARIDPNLVPDSLFGDAVVALIAGIVDVEHRNQHVDDVAAPISEAVRLTYNSEVNDTLPDDPRRAILEAARCEFDRRGYFAATLSEIATRSQVPLQTLKQLFPSKDAIFVEAIKSDVAQLALSITDDETVGIDELSTIERHLGRLANMFLSNSELKEAFISVVVQGSDHSSRPYESSMAVIDLPKLITPVIENGQRLGVISSSDNAYDMASILTHTLMLHCFSNRTKLDAGAIAETVSRTLLYGMRTRR